MVIYHHHAVQVIDYISSYFIMGLYSHSNYVIILNLNLGEVVSNWIWKASLVPTSQARAIFGCMKNLYQLVLKVVAMHSI